MKTRTGLVSNSSSSSFVVLLPDNFDIKAFVEQNWENAEVDFDEYDVEDEKFETLTGLEPTYDNKLKVYIEEKLNELIEGDLYDDHGALYMLSYLLKDYVIASINSGPDEGQIICLTDEEKQKIREILGC